MRKGSKREAGVGIWQPTKISLPMTGAGTLILLGEAEKPGFVLPGGRDGFREPHHCPPTFIARSLRLFAGVKAVREETKAQGIQSRYKASLYPTGKARQWKRLPREVGSLEVFKSQPSKALNKGV